ncbi:hypothetical protein HYT05_02860 [Candidatus Kaiserbacteria bacterium]|nr:hypothetical protein [Candidatus Kaiserbacteria bacterium]
MGSLIKETPFSEITATLEILDRLGVGRDDLRKFRAAAPEVQSRIAEILRTANSLTRISTIAKGVNPGIFRLTVDYTQTLEQMIAAGRYDWKNSDITAERFSLVGDGVVDFEIKLFHFKRSISSEDADEAIKNDGWESAKIEHLLAFGAKYPEEQRKFPIVGLGSSAQVSGGRYVPCLYGGDSLRCLDLAWWGGGWAGYYRFLAVRKLSSGA